jgi:hypothetical protein
MQFGCRCLLCTVCLVVRRFYVNGRQSNLPTLHTVSLKMIPI